MLYHVRMALYQYVMAQIKTIPDERVRKNLLVRASGFNTSRDCLCPDSPMPQIETIEQAIDTFKSLMWTIANKKEEVQEAEALKGEEII